MNTKQVEELVGISRQNLRYYEKIGLLSPCREENNSYRDYSKEDIDKLEIIKMLRMLDMPVKEIEKVLKEEISMQEAAANWQKTLMTQQKQLQAAIDICALLKKEKTKDIPVQKYLEKMKRMENNGNVFARIIDDYKKIIYEEEENSIFFYAEDKIRNAEDFEKVLKKYAKQKNLKLKMRKKGLRSEFYINQELYYGIYSFDDSGCRVICRKINNIERKDTFLRHRYKKILMEIHGIRVNIGRHQIKSICSMLLSFLLIMVLGIYLENLAKIEVQIDKLTDAIPVYGKIYSNTGESDCHLLIGKDIVDGVRQSEYLGEIEETVELFTENETGNIYEILAVEDKKLDSGNTKNINCIVEPSVLQIMGVKVGDNLKLPVYCYIPDIISGGLSGYLLGEIKLNIVESMEMEESIRISLDSAKRLFQQADVNYQASSLSFRIMEPEYLNLVKKEMTALGLKPIQSGEKESYIGKTLGIKDAAFIEASVRLEQNKALFRFFFPMIVFLLLMVQYFLSFLILQSRRQEFAIMRALGKNQKECFYSFLAEQIFLSAVGIAAGCIVCLLMKMQLKNVLQIFMIFVFIAVVGINNAVRMLGKFHVAAVLTCRD